MTKSELINNIAIKQSQLSSKDVFGSLLGLLFGLRLMKVFKLKAEIRQLKKIKGH